MAKTHIVKPGECLSSIAHDNGFHNWRLIYDADENKKLKRLRPNPNVLQPGDVLVIPDKKVKHRDVPTGAIHRHVVARAKWNFRLVLRDQRGDTLEGIPFELAIDGAPTVTGQSGPDGLIECPVPPHARRGELRLLGQVRPVAFGALDSVTYVSGVQGRLANLGFEPGPIDGIYGPRTARAVYGFQLSQGLPTTGDADDATRKRLLRVHDGDERCGAFEEPMVLSYDDPVPLPAPVGVLLAPLAEDNQREIVIVGAQAEVADDAQQTQDDVSMNFYKAALALTPHANNSGEAVLYVQKNGYSRQMRQRIEATHGWHTSVHFFGSIDELSDHLGAWPKYTVVRLTIIAHGYPDKIVLHEDALGATFFTPLAKLFDSHAVIVSHACRTGDAELAQQIADAANVPVFAWTGRTSYAHKNQDKSLTEIHPSMPPSREEIGQHPTLAWEYVKEIHSRHWKPENEPRFVRFYPAGGASSLGGGR